MSIEFLLGVYGGASQRRATLPRLHRERARRKEPTLDEALRQRIEIWREVDLVYALAMERVLHARVHKG